jgi:uncharacterized membrane protein YkvA (DUF1232 family)
MVWRYRPRMVDDPGPKPIGVKASSTTCQRWSARFMRDARVFITATVDQRVPWYARVSSAAMPIAYLVAPIDPIPNRVPVFGHLDDVIVATLAIALFVRLVPSGLMDQLRADLQATAPEDGVFARPGGRPRGREKAMKAVMTVVGVTVLGAITVGWGALLVCGAIWLIR